MRVTLVAPLVAALRPTQAGGAQTVVVDLARGLAAAGDLVELVAPPGSRVPGIRLRRAPGGPFERELLDLGAPLRDRTTRTPDGLSPVQLATWLRLAAELRTGDGPLHVHAMDWAAFAATAGPGRPVVHTLHLGPVDPGAVLAAAAAARCASRPRFLVPSRTMARQWRRHLPVDAVIPNGVDPALVPVGRRPAADRAVVAGRISPEKGTELAVLAALRAGMRVVIAGSVYDAAYHRERVAPLVDGDAVRHVGALPRSRLLRLLGSAAVAVQASLWEEPFGMVVVEAAMTGTPVAVTPRGALVEVVGRRMGCVAEGVDVPSVARAVRAAAALDRDAVRADAVRRHSLAAAVGRHRALYAALAGH